MQRTPLLLTNPFLRKLPLTSPVFPQTTYRTMTSSSLPSSTYITLSSGSKMPLIGLGLWKADKGLADVIENAIRIGYRHFDSACDYFNEEQTGEGLERAINNGLVKREDLFITSKLWNTYHNKKHVKPALLRTLKDLRLDYLDLFLIHFPISLEYVPFETRYPPGWSDGGLPKLSTAGDTIQQTWEAMEEVLASGLVKNIGVSNFNCQLLQDLLRYAKVKPACNQLEVHPLLPNARLIQYCQYQNIPVVAFSPFGGQSYVNSNQEARTAPSLLTSPDIAAIGAKHNKTSAQVLLRWSIQRGVVAIPKSVNESRLKENLNVFDFELSPEDMKTLNEFNKGVNIRFNNPGGFGGIHCSIWD